MWEQDKIDEAEFFLQEMAQREHDPAAYRHMTSAFLSAGRSVLQYALEESAALDVRHRPTNLVGKSWYDGHVTAHPLLGYFASKRDANVHREPVSVPRDIHEHVVLAASPGMQPEGTVVRNGAVLAPEASCHDAPTPSLAREGIVPKPAGTTRYRFQDWPGPEDVPTLCRQYIDELRRVVADGQARGFLTP